MGLVLYLLKGQRKGDFRMINSKGLLTFVSATDPDEKEGATSQGSGVFLMIIIRIRCAFATIPL